MTIFWRNGFYRMNAYGTESWVEGHWVGRDDWSRNGRVCDNRENWRSFLNDARASRTLTARIVNPNADCPVCGEPVFFYQNENGSKVYFDELGPPWPKHPCTDNTKYSSPEKQVGTVDGIEPNVRSDDEISSIETCDRLLSTQPELLFESSYGHKPWEVTKVLKRIKSTTGVFLILQKLHGSNGKKVFIHRKSIPKCLKEGSIVMMRKSDISFFDIASMKHIEIQVRRVKSATAFIDDLTAIPQDSPE